MPSLGKHQIRVGDRDDYFYFEYVINVNTKGIFTTTLDVETAKIIQAANIRLSTNGRSNGRKGYFESETKQGLIDKVRGVALEFVSRELIHKEIVLQYSIASYCSFAWTMEGEIIPNPGWTLDGAVDTDSYWQNGTEQTHAANPKPTGILFYAKPYWKKTYQYRSGKTKIEYDEFTPFGGTQAKSNQYYLNFLENVCSTKAPTSVKEIVYTEERAKFFVNLFKSLCKMAHTIAQFEEPEAMLALIDSGKQLMTGE